MKPTQGQTQKIHIYFNKVLGYGNKCSKCHKQGKMTMISADTVTFSCSPCKNNWNFQSGVPIKDMIICTFGIPQN